MNDEMIMILLLAIITPVLAWLGASKCTHLKVCFGLVDADIQQKKEEEEPKEESKIELK
jgi:hypothetical protein